MVSSSLVCDLLCWWGLLPSSLATNSCLPCRRCEEYLPFESLIPPLCKEWPCPPSDCSWSMSVDKQRIVIDCSASLITPYIIKFIKDLLFGKDLQIHQRSAIRHWHWINRRSLSTHHFNMILKCVLTRFGATYSPSSWLRSPSHRWRLCRPGRVWKWLSRPEKTESAPLRPATDRISLSH